MHHRKSGKRLNRSSDQRTALFRSLITALMEHETIRTTLIRAKELRRFAEPLISIAREDSVAHRRLVFNRLRDKSAVKKLFEVIGPTSRERKGGYLRVLKCGYRFSDSAPMAIVELVDKDKFQPAAEKKAEPKKQKAKA